MQTALNTRLVAAAALTLACVACASTDATPPAVETAPAPSTNIGPPTADELRNTTYAGVDGSGTSIALVNGRWTGAPPASGGASRPVVELVEGVRVVGDLDRDRLDEAVVLLTYRTGGTATFVFLAVVTRRDGMLRNVATTPLGDRTQVRGISIDAGRLLVSGVRAGLTDAACCPGELVDWRWTLDNGRLTSAGEVTTARLSLDTLGGTVWVLHAWDVTEPAGSAPVVSLAYDAGRFTGSSGCNRFFATVAGGPTPGELKMGPVGGTRMACPDPQSSVEARFLGQLAAARTFGFRAGRLAIAYAKGDGGNGTMLFDMRPR